MMTFAMPLESLALQTRHVSQTEMVRTCPATRKQPCIKPILEAEVFGRRNWRRQRKTISQDLISLNLHQ